MQITKTLRNAQDDHQQKYSQNQKKNWLAFGKHLNPHLITIAASLLPRSRSFLKCPFEQLLIPVDSESVVRADAHLNSAGKDCLIIVHGLEGSSISDYVLSLGQKALALGFNVVRLNLRNCGNTLHLTPTLYNAGQSGDLLQVIKWLAQWKGQHNQYLIGYSLGGNLVLKTLAEIDPIASPVKGGCVVSPSIDLAASVKRIGERMNKIYEYCFLRSLKNKIRQKSKLFPHRYDASKLSKVNSLFAFDDLYTATDAGYSGAADYYRSASSGPLLNNIKIPTLIITAQDDPLVPFDAFSSIDNPNLRLLAPTSGGHVAFLAANNKDCFLGHGRINLAPTELFSQEPFFAIFR